MERLTKRVGTHVIYDGVHSHYEGGDIPAEMSHDGIRDTLRRLADYEDTGLEPAEIAEIAETRQQLIEQTDLQKLADTLVELGQMAKDGRLVAVPIPGTVMYETDPEHGVVEHTVTEVHWVANTNAKDDNGNTWADYYTDEDIETAHETRGVAEAVLATGSIMEG